MFCIYSDLEKKSIKITCTVSINRSMREREREGFNFYTKKKKFCFYYEQGIMYLYACNSLLIHLLQNGVTFEMDMMGSELEPTIRTTKDRPATTQQLEPQSLPPQLGKTLEQIVGQLDVLTQVSNCYCNVIAVNVIPCSVFTVNF